MMIFEVLAGALVGVVIFVPTGYVAAWLTNLAGMRSAPLPRRLLISLPASVAVLPMATYWTMRFTGQRALIFFPILALAGLILITLAERDRWPQMRRELIDLVSRHRWWWIGAIAWAFFAAACLADVEIVGTLYTTPATIDYQKHVSVTDAICRTGVPPANPSLFPGRPIPLYYYYLWFLTSALVRTASCGAIGTYSATLAATVWAGYALAATILLWLHRFSNEAEPTRKGLIYRLAMVLLALTGLDIIVLIAIGLGQFLDPAWLVSAEWCLTGIAYWFTLVTWVPHHVAGCVACLAGMLAIRDVVSRPSSLGEKIRHSCFAGVAFASAAGSSIWLAFVAAAVLGVWLLRCAMRGRWAETGVWTAAGATALVFVLPFALDLRAARDDRTFPIAFEIRRTAPLDWVLDLAGVSKSGPLRWGSNLAILPVSYAMEFGIFALGGFAYWRFRRRTGRMNDDDTFQITLAVVPLVVCSFFRSAMHNNDLGWRGVIYSQFAMHLWTTWALARLLEAKTTPDVRNSRRWWLTAIGIAGAIGLAGTAYDAVKWRTYTWCPEAADLKAAYVWCRDHTRPEAVFQHFPVPVFEFDANDVFHGLYGDRQVALADGHYGRLYGIGEENYKAVERQVELLFAADTPWATVRQTAQQLRIDYVLVRSKAPVWNVPTSWVWTVQPVFENTHVRVFAVSSPDALPMP